MNEELDELYEEGVDLMHEWLQANEWAGIEEPMLKRLVPGDDLYDVKTCAFYRPSRLIVIMVEKCAVRGRAGRAWSWPGYVIDRTPYGVLQHELGHHVDHSLTRRGEAMFSQMIHDKADEPPLTGYLGTDKRAGTYYKEWFAEHFRLFVTNPELCRLYAPGFYNAVVEEGLKPLTAALGTWEQALDRFEHSDRIVDMATKKIFL